MIWTRWPPEKNLVSTDCSIYSFVCYSLRNTLILVHNPGLFWPHLIKWTTPCLSPPVYTSRTTLIFCITNGCERKHTQSPSYSFSIVLLDLHIIQTKPNSFHKGQVTLVLQEVLATAQYPILVPIHEPSSFIIAKSQLFLSFHFSTSMMQPSPDSLLSICFLNALWNSLTIINGT